eukprot:1470394-Pleurochrysis_carterae.AAC.4
MIAKRRSAVYRCVLRCDYKGEANFRVAWRGELTLPKIPTLEVDTNSLRSEAPTSSPRADKRGRYRHWLLRGPIGRLGTPSQDNARLHLACTSYFYFRGSYLDAGATIRGRAGK